MSVRISSPEGERNLPYCGENAQADILAVRAKPFDWDTSQMPINMLDAHYRSFQRKVMPEYNRRKIGVIGMKALACGAIPKEVGLSAEVCRRYALSVPISTLVCGITSRKELRQDLQPAPSDESRAGA